MCSTLARENLLHRKARTLTILAGISFPIALVFIQLGFYSAVLGTATLIFNQLDADVFLISRAYLNISRSGHFPKTRLYQAWSVPGVKGVSPLYIGLRFWKNPVTRIRRQILVMGCDPADKPFVLPDLQRYWDTMVRPDTVLIDTRSRPEYGSQDPGLTVEIAGRKNEISGQYTMGTGLSAFGGLVVSDQNYSRLFKGYSLENVSIGLVKLKPGADSKKVAAQLAQVLPPDVRVLTRIEMEEFERAYWTRTTSIGTIFGIGVTVAFGVGFLILYQVLSSDITRRFPEYATLKAIGYTEVHLAFIVLQQALTLTLIAYIPAFLLSLVVYKLTRDVALLPTYMNPSRAVSVLVLVVAMASASGWVALRKVRLADPADLF